MDASELEYASKIKSILENKLREESDKLSKQRESIIKSREYFSEYLPELHEDEVRDLLLNESYDMYTYESGLSEVSTVARQINNPYFAGFDFEEDNADDYDESRFYLGVNAVTDPETDDYLVYDWRAPIASLYYEKEIGHTFFEAPAGKIFGDLKAKRRYKFKKGTLAGVYDLKMPSDDELLLSVLESHSQSNMKTIVESIQADQHKIIADYTDGCSVLQGCAGSGKSSIALHKIAYIMYAFRKNLEGKNLVILSPNDYFTDYISTVLPDLGEHTVTTKIPENIVDDAVANALDFNYRNQIESRIYMESLDEKQRKIALMDHKFKGSERFREIILEYSKYLKKNLFVPQPFYLDEDEGEDNVLTAEEIRNAFDSFDELPYFSRTAEIATLLCDNHSLKKDIYFDYLCEAINQMYVTFSVSELYKRMFSDTDFIKECEEPSLPLYMPDTVLWYDAVAIAILTIDLYGELYKTEYFYMIADEAQDFSPIFLELLAKRFKKTNMLFVGDSSQTVFGNSGNYEEDIKRIIKRRPFRYYELDTNYRSTKEIMDFTNKLAGNEKTATIKCIRSGKEPEYEKIFFNDDTYEVKKKEAANKISEYLVRQNSLGYEHAAVICSTNREAYKMNELVSIPYDCAIEVKFLPVYLAKGLEFDSVAVLIDGKNPFERTSLYTACTRAMHDLLCIELAEE